MVRVGLTLFSQNLVAVHEGDYTATMSWPPSAAMQQCIWGEDTIPCCLRRKEGTAGKRAASGGCPGFVRLSGLASPVSVRWLSDAVQR